MALPLKPKTQEEKDRIAETILSDMPGVEQHEQPGKEQRTQSGEYGHYNLLISRELRARVRAAATLQRLTMNEFIIKAVTELVEKS